MTSPLPFESLTHIGALKQLRSISDELLRNDFVVVDVILQPTAFQRMSEYLMRSTIWFDCTNGLAAVAHFDDGLVDDSFAHLAQQLAWALSVNGLRYKVVKYYATSMSLQKQHSNHSSPVSMSNKDELTVILWMNPTDEDRNSRGEEEEALDGVRIYDDLTAGKLFSQGISVYPSVHPDFLSKSGDLFIDIQSRCEGAVSETVPRKPNRLVVVKARKPFLFVGGNEHKKQGSGDDNFVDNHMVAFVVVISILK